MSLAAVGTAANVLGLIMPAKDIGEIIKGVADSIQEVKSNEESTSYWDKTLKEHAKDVYSFLMRYKEAGANDSQTRSLMKLIESLIILRKEIIENSRRSYVAKLYASGDIKRKIEMVEKKVKQCHDLFVADTLSSHTSMLLQLSRNVCEVVDREGRNYSVERTAIQWKVPIFQIFDIYCGISKYLIEERGYHRELRLFLDAGISILQNPAMASHAQRNQILACLLNDGAYLLYEVGSYKDALSASDESVAIYRILAAEDAEEHESNLVMSLYRLGRSQLVTGEANAAWTSAEEGIDLCIEREDPQCISGLLRNLLLLRGDIQFDLGRVPGVHDVLLESLLLEIAPDRDIDLNFNYGYNLPKPDVANNSRFGEDDESESESVYMSALDGAESGDF